MSFSLKLLPLALACATSVHADDTGATTDPRKATVLEGIRVNATAVDAYRTDNASAGALGNRALLDTPFSIDAVTEELIKNRQANNINDVFKGDASTTPFSNGYSGENSAFSVRGLQIDELNGYRINGMSVPAWAADIPVEHFQQIELLKGLSGFMYGFSQPGGMLNFVTKKPTEQPTATFRLGYTSRSSITEEADLGGRFGKDHQFGYRLDAVNEQGGTYVDNGYIKRKSVSLGLDWRINDQLTWHFDSLYQDRHIRGAMYGVIPCQDFGVCQPNGPQFVSIPSPLKGSQRISSTDTGYGTSMRMATTGVTWNISPDWTLSADAAMTLQGRSNRDSAIFLLDNQGQYLEHQYLGYTDYLYRSAQAMLNGHFETGSLKHDVVIGAAWQKNMQRYGDNIFDEADLGIGNIHNPSDFPQSPIALIRHVRDSSSETQGAVFASDTVTFSEQWQALLGLRAIDYTQSGYNYFGDGKRNALYERKPVTPTVALMYKPAAWMTVYASYVKSLEEGTSVPAGQGYANEGEVFAPMTSKQYELGAKFAQDSWNLNAAVFRIERGLAYSVVRDNQRFMTQDGQVRFDGFELSGQTRLGSQWTLLGSAMWLDATNERADPTVEGKRAFGSARFQASSYIEYAVPTMPGWVLTAGGRYVGNRPLESNNSNIAGAYHTFDVGTRVTTRVGQYPVTFRLNLDNITNEKYWLVGWESIMNQGAPRVLRASVEVALQ
ncbi:TonB-dependent receptor [Dyella sp. GSA-30]|uniref:TonB-dependent siderophore receptor n=1 Tax=Dyella sp. GSA-30 TaxID=2994496 RepID=UPI0024933D30|nr:TonB-dependent receptor [Dyella sp. GSA-30]BDU22488.1 ligand-gated channel protein [Dyella sp. GSA-30]